MKAADMAREIEMTLKFLFRQASLGLSFPRCRVKLTQYLLYPCAKNKVIIIFQ